MIRKLQEQQDIKHISKQLSIEATIFALETQLRVNSQPEESNVMNLIVTHHALDGECKEPGWSSKGDTNMRYLDEDAVFCASVQTV